MKFAKSFLMGSGALLLAGLVLTLVAPKAAHAIAATAVQVENTRSSPVPNQDVDIAARHVFTQTCSIPNAANCELFPYSVPANNEFVIQNVSMAFSYSGALDGPPTVATLNVTQGGQPATNNFPILQQMNQGTLTQNLAINQQVTLYADPGTYSTCTMTTLTGYLAGGNFSCGNAR